jgi:hypothetical protein
LEKLNSENNEAGDAPVPLAREWDSRATRRALTSREVKIEADAVKLKNRQRQRPKPVSRTEGGARAKKSKRAQQENKHQTGALSGRVGARTTKLENQILACWQRSAGQIERRNGADSKIE